MKTQKLGIIGVGNVGSAVLDSAIRSGQFGEIALIDTRDKVAFGEGLDHTHATGLISRSNTKIFEGTYEDLADAEVIIVTATHVYDQVSSLDRQALMRDNAPIVRQIMRDIAKVTNDAIVIFITNPADTVVYVAANEFDYPSERIIGTGTMLDTARMRQIVGEQLNVDPKSVNGFVLGEHGATAFPAMSHLTIGSIPYEEFTKQLGTVEAFKPDELKERVVKAAHDVYLAKKGVTNSAIGQAAVDLAKSILLNEHSIYPVSTLMSNQEYGFEKPVAYSVPCIVGRSGIEKKLLPNLNEFEIQKLSESVDSILKSIELAESVK